MGEIAPIDNRPWIPRPLPSWLAKELTRRKSDFGINYKSNENLNWTDKKNPEDWNQYKGPMAPWARICSNGTGKVKFLSAYKTENDVKPNDHGGFVMYGGMGFKDSFGIGDNKNVLGYTVTGEPLKLPIEGSGFNYTISTVDKSYNERTVPMYLPPPGIISIETTIQKELIRNVTIKWNCYGFAQLEYLTPYFLTPGISMIVEFGWNHFNADSLLDLRDDISKEYMVLDKYENEVAYDFAYTKYSVDRSKNTHSATFHKTAMNLKDLWTDGTPLYECNVRKSRGMYDVTFGSITNFEFTTTDGIKWDCTTTIGSKHRNFSGVQLNSPNSENKKDAILTKKQGMTFPQFIDTRLKKVKIAATEGKNFFDPLDSTETDKAKFTLYLDREKFYGGKAEDRVFFGRQSGNNFFGSSDSSDTITTTETLPDGVEITRQYRQQTGLNIPQAGNWDKESNDTIWVTGGFLIEICNYFLTKPSDLKTSNGETFNFYQIESSASVIGAHPNLLSVDGNILLIPNSNAPKYNIGYGYKDIGNDKKNIYDSYDEQTLIKNSEIFLNYYQPLKETRETMVNLSKISDNMINKKFISDADNTYLKDNSKYFKDIALFSTFSTGKIKGGSTGVARDDLDSIINVIRYKKQPSENKKHAFPQPTDTGNFTGGYYGYFEDLFINVDHIINLAKDCETAGDFYKKFLDSLNDATNGFWDLQITEGAEKLIIRDQKYFSPKDFKNVDVFQFDISSGTNIIKNLSFTSTISNIQANQVIASSTSNQGGGESSTNAPLGIAADDRLFSETTDSGDKQRQSVDNYSIILQLQKYGKTDKDKNPYPMTFKSGDNVNIVNLVLPDKALLTSILDDKDFSNNMNLYGGQQPNFTLELTLQGIAGFRTFQCFSIKNFPRPYSDQEVIFQIVDVVHTLTNSNWETRIKAGIRPLRGNITPNYIDSVN